MVAFRQSLLPIALVLVACSTPRSEPRAETPPVATGASIDAGGPSVKQDHFIFKGPDAERAGAKARVEKALKKDAALPNHPTSYSAIPDLDVFLEHHYVSVTPEGKTLKVDISPATENPSWEMFFTVTADDNPKDITVAQLATMPARR